MKKLISKFLNLFFRIFKVNEKKIVFESFFNKADGNPLALYLYIKKNYPSTFQCYWLVSKKTDISYLDKNDVIYYRTLKSYFHLATAKYWIKSQSTGSLIKKRKNQVYLMVEHSGGVFKKCGYDIKSVYPGKPLDFVKEWSYYIASDKRNAKMMRSATGYQGEIEILGLARTDMILDTSTEYINSIKQKLNILQDTRKIVMYAPTFRNKDLTNYTFCLPLEEFEKLSNCIFLIKLHPQAKGLEPTIKLPNNVIDISYYHDTQELLLITDLLITDYSSIVFEYNLLNKPSIFYMYDLNEYIKERGGFDLDIYTELPGPIAYTKEELVSYISDNRLKEKYISKINQVNKEFNYLNDGKVCKRIVEKLINGEFIP